MERQFTRQAHVTPQSLAHPALTLMKFDAERHYAAVSIIERTGYERAGSDK